MMHDTRHDIYKRKKTEDMEEMETGTKAYLSTIEGRDTLESLWTKGSDKRV